MCLNVLIDRLNNLIECSMKAQTKSVKEMIKREISLTVQEIYEAGKKDGGNFVFGMIAGD